MGLTIGETELPVIASVDAAVVGGSFAGLACSLELAKAGRRVMVIEPRTYLGRELTATLRPWLAVQGEAERPELIRLVLQDQEPPAGGSGFVPLHPDRLKLSLEEALEARGIGLLYASLPVGVETDGGRISGLVIANKSGRQLIRCKEVVDATETALVAGLCGDDVSGSEAEARYYRTLEFVGVRFDEGVRNGFRFRRELERPQAKQRAAGVTGTTGTCSSNSPSPRRPRIRWRRAANGKSRAAISA